MDLVVGATGFVGRQAALELRKRGRAVRAMVRGGAARAEAAPLLAAGIEVVAGDLTDRASVEQSCAGIETVVSTATSMPQGRDDDLRRIDHEGTLGLMEAAERAGVARFVYVSYSGNVRIDSPLETAKRACENRLLAGKMKAVILRPSYFMEVWLSPAVGFDPANARARIYGAGENQVSYISGGNVAEFAAAAASGGAGPPVLELGGPEAMTQLQAIRIFEKKWKKKIAAEFVPLATLQAQYVAATDPVQKTFAALMLGYAAGDRIMDSRANAARYRVRLRSVEEYAAGLAGR